MEQQASTFRNVISYVAARSMFLANCDPMLSSQPLCKLQEILPRTRAPEQDAESMKKPDYDPLRRDMGGDRTRPPNRFVLRK